MSKKVKNIAGQRLAIPNIGVVEADAIVTVPDSFNNPNFEVAKSEKPAVSKKEEKTETVENAPTEEKKGDKKSK